MDTTFTNDVTVSDSDWFNDVNRLHYTILGDPADIAAVKDTLHSAPGAIGDVTPSTVAATTVTADNAVITGFARKNAIINGGFDVWQRGTSSTSSGYVAPDRWYCSHNGSTKTVSRQSFTVGQTDVPGNPSYYMRHVVTSVAGAGNLVVSIHRIEDVMKFAGETIHISLYAKADAARNIGISISQNFGSGGSTQVDSTGQLIALGTTWAKKSVTVAVPSITGKTIGSTSGQLEIILWFDAGSSFDTRSGALGQQSGTFDIAQVQVERGSVATEFERRSFGEELALCQRYYEKSFPIATAPAQAAGGTGAQVWAATTSGTTSQIGASVRFVTRKRVSPTLTFYNPYAANAQARDFSASLDCSGTGAFATSDASFVPLITGNAGTGTANQIHVHWTADAEI